LRVVVLISGTGTLLRAVLQAVARGELNIDVVGVGADREASGLAFADEVGVPTFVLPLVSGSDRAAWDRDLTRRVAHYQPDVVVSAGFMRLVGPAFLARYNGRFLNTHPALLPSFPGVHGVRDALAYGVKVTGCTVFVVDEGVDTGPILDQVAVPVLPGDDEASLHERIKVEERRLLIETLRSWSARWAAVTDATGRPAPYRDQEPTGRPAPYRDQEATGRPASYTDQEPTGRPASHRDQEPTGRPASYTDQEATGPRDSPTANALLAASRAAGLPGGRTPSAPPTADRTSTRPLLGSLDPDPKGD
jgi:formyltetrahydrofolate-dependent phosphoribosylglycinamide formyltransferase